MCNCCATRVNASSVAVASGVTTITIPATVTPVDETRYRIYLRVTIPSGTDYTQLSITNGTVTASIMNHSANYFRMCALKGWMVLTVRYLNDPSHFIIERVGK